MLQHSLKRMLPIMHKMKNINKTLNKNILLSIQYLRVRVGIIHQNYPDELLTVEQMNAVEEAVIAQIMEVEGAEQPTFSGMSRKPGYMIVNCDDQPTSTWLTEAVKRIMPWKGAKLKAVLEGEIPRSHVVTAYLPNSSLDSSEYILECYI
ncbi:hypothetical protein LSTR_LSTR013337 [Laodelphax striatellus]|uniref:DUF4780 domain-containing protein n=1 Tax=Laodelphax striatellus TaxID=195883 RepID=A0A482XBY3_LAOST|nr:hypothetical protein LSTR_LSTR013337 [Laodelphax striatellus]